MRVSQHLFVPNEVLSRTCSLLPACLALCRDGVVTHASRMLGVQIIPRKSNAGGLIPDQVTCERFFPEIRKASRCCSVPADAPYLSTWPHGFPCHNWLKCGLGRVFGIQSSLHKQQHHWRKVSCPASCSSLIASCLFACPLWNYQSTCSERATADVQVGWQMMLSVCGSVPTVNVTRSAPPSNSLHTVCHDLALFLCQVGRKAAAE